MESDGGALLAIQPYIRLLRTVSVGQYEERKYPIRNLTLANIINIDYCFRADSDERSDNSPQVSSQTNHYSTNYHESSTSNPLVRNPPQTHRSSSAFPDLPSVQSVSAVLTPSAACQTASPSPSRHLEYTFSASYSCFRETNNRNPPATTL